MEINSFIWDLDAYKVGHMSQYPEDTKSIYSVMQLRSNKNFSHTPVIGIQYLIRRYLTEEITQEKVDALIEELKLMGVYHHKIGDRLNSLVKLGYFPLKICAVPEGSIIELPNAVCTIENTVPGFHWLVGFFETLLLKWWSALTTGSISLGYRLTTMEAFQRTSCSPELIPFAVHDFGSRGCASTEGAAFTGMAHTLSFNGSDTIASIPLLRKYYNAKGMIIQSIPASEHSIMCSFGKDEELDAFRHMLSVYPKGLVSIVSDTYNWYNVMDKFIYELKDEILNRDGKVVFRPDSGDPLQILFGTITERIPDEELKNYDAKELGGIRALDKAFGHTVNEKGFKVLNSKVGIIYGDVMFLTRYTKALEILEYLGYAAENLVIGVGGILRMGTRDTLSVAFKATCVEREGRGWIPIEKDPITDTKKKSYKGFVNVVKDSNNVYTTHNSNKKDTEHNQLKTIFENGKVTMDDWSVIKERFNNELKELTIKIAQGKHADYVSHEDREFMDAIGMGHKEKIQDVKFEHVDK